MSVISAKTENEFRATINLHRLKL